MSAAPTFVCPAVDYLTFGVLGCPWSCAQLTSRSVLIGACKVHIAPGTAYWAERVRANLSERVHCVLPASESDAVPQKTVRFLCAGDYYFGTSILFILTAEDAFYCVEGHELPGGPCRIHIIQFWLDFLMDHFYPVRFSFLSVYVYPVHLQALPSVVTNDVDYFGVTFPRYIS